jgi:hypothetical protein
MAKAIVEKTNSLLERIIACSTLVFHNSFHKTQKNMPSRKKILPSHEIMKHKSDNSDPSSSFQSDGKRQRTKGNLINPEIF